LVALLAVAGLASLATWDWMSRASANALAELRTENATLNAYHDSVVTTLHDSIASIRQYRDTVIIERVIEAEARADTTATRLQDYLAGDSIGTALLASHLEADSLEREAHETEKASLRQELLLANQVIFRQDSTITELRVLCDKAMAEAETWYRRANPPFHIRLLKDGWKFAAGVGLGYLIAN
jgi:hypothetical protein